MQEIKEMLKIPKSTIDRHIQRLGLVKKLDIWIPHGLKEVHLRWFERLVSYEVRGTVEARVT